MACITGLFFKKDFINLSSASLACDKKMIITMEIKTEDGVYKYGIDSDSSVDCESFLRLVDIFFKTMNNAIGYVLARKSPQ